MNIIAVSDLHGYLPRHAYPDGDVFVVAGDILPDLRPIQLQQQWAIEELAPWLRQKAEQYRNVIVTWGNHDFVDAWGPPVAEQLHTLLNDFSDGPPKSFTYIVARPQVIHLGKYIFYVSPYCLELPGWAYHKTESLLAEDYRQIPIGTDVIISHGPPLDMCDKIDGLVPFHAGSKALKDAVKHVQPQVVICGHIHEAYGMKTVYHSGKTLPTCVYNVAQLDVRYKYHNRPVEITL